MKKTNLILPVLTRKNAFRCGVVALALVTMTGCKDDAPGIDGPGGNDVTETVEGVDLSVLSNPALAKTYYNSKLFGSRAANDDDKSDHAEDFEKVLDNVRKEVAVVPAAEYSRFAQSFAHIFAGGYSAGYYSYKWAEVLSADAFSAFEEEGLFNPATGKRWVDEVLSRGSSRDAIENFRAFRGRDPSIEPLLRHSGIL